MTAGEEGQRRLGRGGKELRTEGDWLELPLLWLLLRNGLRGENAPELGGPRLLLALVSYQTSVKLYGYEATGSGQVRLSYAAVADAAAAVDTGRMAGVGHAW